MVLFFMCFFVVASSAQDTSQILSVEGSVFYNDGATLVPNGWKIDVTNKTQNLPTKSGKTGETAGDGRYGVTFMTFGLGAFVAATGDEIEITVTDADGNTVRIIDADGNKQDSLIYTLTASEIKASSTIADITTDIPVPPEPIAKLVVSGTVYYDDKVSPAAGLTVKTLGKSQKTDVDGKYTFTIAVDDLVSGSEISITVEKAGEEVGSIQRILGSPGDDGSLTITGADIITSVPVPPKSTQILAIEGSVFYNDKDTLVPNGWSVNVTNKTQNLPTKSGKTGETAGDGRYGVTFMTFELGAFVATTGDEIEITVTDADGNAVQIIDADGTKQDSLTYSLTGVDIDTGSVIVDITTDASAPPKPITKLVVSGKVYKNDGVTLAPAGLTVKLDLDGEPQKTNAKSEYTITIGDGTSTVVESSTEISVIVEKDGKELGRAQRILPGPEEDGSLTITKNVNLSVIPELTIDGTVYAKDKETLLPDGFTINIANSSRPNVKKVSGTITNGKYSVTLVDDVAAAGLGDGITATVADAEGNTIGEQSYNLTSDDITANAATIDVVTTFATSVTFTLTLGEGLSMISIPLANSEATANGIGPMAISKVGDLKTLLGESASVYYYSEGKFKEAPDDMEIKGDVGLIVMLVEATTITFDGEGWPGDINLVAGLNMFAVPLDSPETKTVGDLKLLLGDAPVYYYDTEGGKFQKIEEDALLIKGGVGYITMLQEPTTLSIDGDAWEAKGPPPPPAPAAHTFNSTSTPLMEVKGTVINENTSTVFNGLSVTVCHLYSGAVITDTTGSSNVNDGQFSAVFLNPLNNQSFKIGDVFKIDIHSSNGNIGFEPIQYTVTQEDVKLGRINLGDLTIRTIPKSSKLMQNWPNPFNPETWIPFQLSKAADVTVTIYDIHGRVVRQLDLGQTPAGIYDKKFNAIYWNGTNDFGERVSSGVYFYHIQAGEFSASRKMAILK
jgi:hypothetical protein